MTQQRRNCTKQRGQTLTLFLGFSAALVGVMLVAFNSGQVTNAKVRAMNAADAAAYSGAVWQARALNFQAYMNRAMVVNEVTIAQSVSLRSWVSYVNRFVANINTITRFIPYVGTATNAISNALDRTDDVMQDLLPYAESALRAVNMIEHGAQNAIHLSGAAIATDLANEVAQRNGAELSSGNAGLFMANQLVWSNLTRTYSKTTGRVGTDDRTRMREVVLNSRDGFTRARDWNPTILFSFELRKQGGTDLINFDSWKGLDSAELRTRWRFLTERWRRSVAVGWGGAQAYAPRSATSVGRHGDFNEWRNTDGRRANNVANRENAAQLQAGAGSIEFQGYRDISRPTVKDANLRIPFAVEVVIKDARIPNANSALGAKVKLTDWSTIEHDPNYAGQDRGVYALAEACVAYARPNGGERGDRAREYPSLFNPYWRASLATESRTSRAIVDGIKGLPPIASLLGEGSCS